MLQIDLQKAYDTVEWDALEDILRELNFPMKFVRWVMICVRTVSYRYSINGVPSRLLQAQRRIRQGDPISPLLFVLVMEYLHRKLQQLRGVLNFNFHPRCEWLNIVNICFADDLLMFCRGDLESVRLMMQRFGQFSGATGLKSNMAKCRLYCGGIPQGL